MDHIERFRYKIAVGDDEIADLYKRLRQTRWPETPEGPEWKYGTSLRYLRGVIDYWISQFDWRQIEKRLNTFTHYRIPIDGRRLHCVIERGSDADAAPLVLFHGWPGSFVEYLPVVRRLVAEGETVIVASLPGAAFSESSARPIGPRELGRTWHRLLTENLGFSHYALHGGDLGAAVSSWMAIDFRSSVRGIHLTSPILQADANSSDPPLRPEEKAYLQARNARGPWEFGYQAIQGSKPLTLSYGLTDSPSGLAAWILEKYHGWSASKGTDEPPCFALDDLLTIVTLYWLAGPGPSTWIYRSLLDGTGLRVPNGSRVTAPTWLCRFADDISPQSPDCWQERIYNVVNRTEIGFGSHFPGLDAVEPLFDDLIKFMRSLA